MARRTRYQLDRVTVEAGEQRPSTWTFGGTPVSGTEQTYSVRDTNFPARNQWDFLVRTPSVKDGRVEVRPRTTPNVKVWAELTDRSITFMRATKGDTRGKWYCKVALADPTGRKSRDVVRGDERGSLPPWFDALKGRMRMKQSVRATRGNDGEDLVVLVAGDDHAAMIRLFFATKVWVLKEGIALGK
ncbi:MAG TPA: hypothetical protein VFH26_09465 [Gemmatimonadales bacterium]|nr:hypothetical protein [Gemmatimonadales bacterium]